MLLTVWSRVYQYCQKESGQRSANKQVKEMLLCIKRCSHSSVCPGLAYRQCLAASPNFIISVCCRQRVWCTERCERFCSGLQNNKEDLTRRLLPYHPFFSFHFPGKELGGGVDQQGLVSPACFLLWLPMC